MRRNKYSTNLWRQDVNPGRLPYRFWALKTSRPTSLKARPTTVWKRCSSQTNGEKKRASVLTSYTSLCNCSLTDCAPCDANAVAAACQTAVHLHVHKTLSLRAVFQSHTRARRHGTAFPSNCGLQLCPSKHLQKDSKVISSAASTSKEWELCLIGALYKYT